VLPNSKITAFSNSRTQKIFIDGKAKEKGLRNLTVITGNVVDYEFERESFDRVVSIEVCHMFQCVNSAYRIFSFLNIWKIMSFSWLKSQELWSHQGSCSFISSIIRPRHTTLKRAGWVLTSSLEEQCHLQTCFSTFSGTWNWKLNGGFLESITPRLVRYYFEKAFVIQALISLGLVVQDDGKQEGNLATPDRNLWWEEYGHVVLQMANILYGVCRAVCVRGRRHMGREPLLVRKACWVPVDSIDRHQD